MSVRDLAARIVISARDSASSVIGSVQAKLAGLAIAIGGIFSGASINEARKFESAMSAVQAAAGATADEMGALRAAAEKTGAATIYSSVEAANALENLSKAGLSATQAVEALPAVLDLAQAGGVGLAEASDYITKAVAGMGLAFADAGRVADVLAAGANASNTSVEGLGHALSYAAPLANSLGLSLEYTVAAIGKFADAGIDASRAGTALNSILAQFNDPLSKFRGELADAGIRTNDFVEALRQLEKAGPNGAKAVNAVGQEAGPALRALLNQGIGALDEMAAKLEQSGGSARKFAEAMGDNLDGALKGFASAWEAMLIKIGTPALDTLKTQIQAISSVLSELVSSGTATKFGEVLQKAFQSAGEWAAEFVRKLDADVLIARMQALAQNVGAALDAIGAKAQAAGTTVSLAWHVMAAGVNTVWAAIAGLASLAAKAFASMLTGIQKVVSGLATISFGGVAERLRREVDEIRSTIQMLDETADAWGQSASNAFDAAADSARKARGDFVELVGATDAAAAAEKELAKASSDTAEAGKRAGSVQAAQLKTQLAQAAATEATRVTVEALKAEYERLIAIGDTQGAARALVDMRVEAEKLERGMKGAADQTAELERMMATAGITSDKELKKAAGSAREVYEALKGGGASMREQREAWRTYAEAAIAANDGVVSATLKTEAAMLGMSVSADESGRVVIENLREQKDATDEAGDAAEGASDGILRADAAMQDFGRTVNDTASVAAWFANVINALKDDIAGYSGAAREAVDAAWEQGISLDQVARSISGMAKSARDFVAADLGYSELTSEIARVKDEAAAARASVEQLEYSARFSGGFSGVWSYVQALAEMKASLAEAKAAQLEFDLSVERFYQRVDDGTLTLAQQEGQLQALTRQAEYYGSQELPGLRSALADVTRQLQDMSEAARDAFGQIQDEYDQLQGNLIAIEKRRAASRRDDLTAQRDEAAAAGNRDAVGQLNAALAKLGEVEALRLQEAKARMQAERERADDDRRRRQQESSGRPGPGGGMTPAGNTYHINLGGVLDVNDRVTLDSLGRKLRPVIADLDRKGLA